MSNTISGTQYDAYRTPATGGPLVVAALSVEVKVESKKATYAEGKTVTNLKYKAGVDKKEATIATGKIDAIVWEYNHIYSEPIGCSLEVDSRTKARIRVKGFVIDSSKENDAVVTFVPVEDITDPGSVA